MAGQKVESAECQTNLKPLANYTLSGWVGQEDDVGQSQVSPKLRAQIKGYLQKQGYEITEEAKLLGKSGIEHTFDLMAQRQPLLE